jgi:hypothetical protein
MPAIVLTRFLACRPDHVPTSQDGRWPAAPLHQGDPVSNSVPAQLGAGVTGDPEEPKDRATRLMRYHRIVQVVRDRLEAEQLILWH